MVSFPAFVNSIPSWRVKRGMSLGFIFLSVNVVVDTSVMWRLTFPICYAILRDLYAGMGSLALAVQARI